MVTAIVLITVEHGHVNDVAEALLAIKGIAEVYSVGGRFDLVAIVRVRNNEDISDVVTSKVLAVPNIHTTETLIAFRAFSQHDLEAMFSIGFDD